MNEKNMRKNPKNPEKENPLSEEVKRRVTAKKLILIIGVPLLNVLIFLTAFTVAVYIRYYGNPSTKSSSDSSVTESVEQQEQQAQQDQEDQQNQQDQQNPEDQQDQQDKQGQEGSQTGRNANVVSSSYPSQADAFLAKVPDYSGSPSITVNDNMPYFTDEEKKSEEAFETYSELDIFGRCGVAYANVCKELQPTEERGEIGQVKPTGWHTVKYAGVVEDNYLYNRCHLIGYQLTGENANEKNLITGTRYLNVEGMLPFENEVDDYVERTGNHVLYRVTPMFHGSDLVASGVLIEAWSVEDHGEGICLNQYCYNVQPGITIDYATGDSTLTEETSKNQTDSLGDSGENDTENGIGDSTDNSVENSADNATGNSTGNGEETSYILNTKSMKVHLPTCSGVEKMSEANKQTYEGTLEELISQGYSPCKQCLGE